LWRGGVKYVAESHPAGWVKSVWREVKKRLKKEVV